MSERWWKQARCVELGTDVELFFLADTNAKLRDRLRMRVCGPCPVRKECLRDNLTVPEGMFGGYTRRERQVIARKLNIRSSRWMAFFNTQLDSYESGLRMRAAHSHHGNRVEWLENVEIADEGF